MSTKRAFRFSIRAKVVTLALGLALPPLIVLSLLGINSLDRARTTAIATGSTALRIQAEESLRKRASDKAALYDATLRSISQQVSGVAAYATNLVNAGPPPASESQ